MKSNAHAEGDSTHNGSPTPTVKLGQHAPLVQVNQPETRGPAVDPLNNMPVWAKVAGTLSAAGLVFALFTFLVVNMVTTKDRGAETLERMIDKFDHVLEKHDGRMTEWMRAQGDRNDLAHEKTRAELRVLVDESKKTLSEQQRMHLEALAVLRKIADAKENQQ